MGKILELKLETMNMILRPSPVFVRSGFRNFWSSFMPTEKFMLHSLVRNKSPIACYCGSLLAHYRAAESRVQLTTELAAKERA